MTEAEKKGTEESPGSLRPVRAAILSLIIVIVVLGLALVVLAIGRRTSGGVAPKRVNALERSKDECVKCHRKATPGIVVQYGFSTMAAAEVSCRNCHEVGGDYPGAKKHEGTFVVSPTPAMCGKCHAVEKGQFYASRHAAPAHAALQGVDGFTPEQLQMYKNVPEGSFSPDKLRNKLYMMEGEAVTRFACHGCHDIGEPRPDGYIGQCEKCHLRHAFSLEQARKPETCNACHIGPDHPQWEIYQESPHGIAYATGGHAWNWDAEAGTLDSKDMAAATCALCHMSGFGASGTTHDVGDRLTWYLFSPISERRPAWEDNRVRMQGVCRQCHNEDFIGDFYKDADNAVDAVNAWVRESNDIIAPLKDAGLLTDKPFDEPLDFTHFDLWHHWGRTAKFGAWMQGPDYVQWHGAYEILRELAELREQTAERLSEAGKEPKDMSHEDPSQEDQTKEGNTP